MQDYRANNATTNNNRSIDDKQYIISVRKEWDFMYYSLGKTFKSSMEKVDDIAGRGYNHQPFVTFLIPFFYKLYFINKLGNALIDILKHHITIK